ncbi:HD-GYP domain-containing protein [Sulfurospirillum sp. UCH001]|uniref:HD-GYP domain-containing protein n=1 Tax=Sulfurospirillum sp. UCH001 TaxID=1581011 RepID=UPI00082B742E|nr:HD domain-containing phosphohydrolase [Sulfurospirillum sp. UCH001]
MHNQLNLRELTYALSTALDYVSIDDTTHGKRVAYIACEIGKKLGWRQSKLDKVMLMAMLHDCGVSSTEMHDCLINYLDWEDSYLHCARGASLLKDVPIYSDFADVIAFHHTCWEHFLPHIDEEIKLYANLIYLSDRIDAMHVKFGAQLSHEKEHIRATIKKETPSMFSPKLTEAFIQLSYTDQFWYYLEPDAIHYYFRDWIDHGEILAVSFELLKKIALMFADIVDAKIPYQKHHTLKVATLARYIAELCELTLQEKEAVEIAALLHDLGKLRIPDETLLKTTPLNEKEIRQIRRHGFDAQIILGQIKGFEKIAQIVSMHHETLDAKGYPANLEEAKIPLEARIVYLANTFVNLINQENAEHILHPKELCETLEKMANEHQVDSVIVNTITTHFESCYAKVSFT